MFYNEKITRKFDEQWGTNLSQTYNFGNGLSSDDVWELLQRCIYEKKGCTAKKKDKLVEIIASLPEIFPYAETDDLDFWDKIDVVAGMASEFNSDDIIWYSIDGIKGYMNKEQNDLEKKYPELPPIYWVTSPKTISKIKKHFKLGGKKQQVKELSIKGKMPLGSGIQHVVYPSLKDPSKVFKIAYSEKGDKIVKINNSVIEMFQKYPEIFPIVYNKTDRYVSLERLNTERAEKEYDLLNQALEKDDELYMGDFAYTLFLVFREQNEELENQIDEYFASLPSPLPKLFVKWKNLIKTFFEIMPNDYYSDLHIEQFGYTKDGKLKILDF